LAIWRLINGVGEDLPPQVCQNGTICFGEQGFDWVELKCRRFGVSTKDAAGFHQIGSYHGNVNWRCKYRRSC
jgi:hypothetical protein